MSSPESLTPVRRRPDLALTIGVGATLLAALMPLLRVITPDWWFFGTIVMVAAVLAAGYVARHFAVPAVAVTLIEAAVWLVLLTVLFGRDSALFGIIPTPETFRSVPPLIEAASREVALGSAPLDAEVPLSFLTIGAVGLLAIIIDHVVLTARMPLLAGVGLIAVSLIPAIAVPGEVDVTSFVMLAAGILFLLRAETRSRESRRENRGTAPSGVSAVASGIGAIAVVVAISITPLLPEAATQPGAGFGPRGNTIDPSLALGDDLRQPRDAEVLRLHSDSTTTPYLRAVTLSEFTGRVWVPDAGRTSPLEDGLGEVQVDDDIRVTEYRTGIEVIDLTSRWLPVAFPAVAVDGLEGEWLGVPDNRTVVSDRFSSNQQTYEVITHVPRPTLEQIRDAETGLGVAPGDATSLPPRMPAIVSELALQVTEGAASDYDALVALQRWFRSGEFEYSLDAPVDDAFDGSGLQAIERFLQVRSGYCVHFASTFAVMARTLNMPSRVVVGYLPGTSTRDSIDGETVFSVSSSQLHAWPEVHFEGIGWIPFEPTSGRGVPTTFAPASVLAPSDGTDLGPSLAPGQTPAPTSSLSTDGAPTIPQGGAGSADQPFNPLPVLAIGFGIIVLLAIPSLLREWRRRVQVSAAHAGDAGAAWRELQNTALDLGVPVPASESPRALGARLVAMHGAPEDAIADLVDGIEYASYARGGRHQFALGPQLAEAVTEVRAAMFGAVSARTRFIAIAAPRSLVIRPGSVYAEGAIGTPTSR
ncbi:MAG TPA: DUF3488 and transglutaminase-like domain-containing protein [Microbacterium sp.]|uniref:transglutaminase family protein n=1 Tax=Microbacterium sp. TaxID=51671 RepID=UPI002C5157A9|nr:DUF3488 and transglutaminase-like domain-containing protein [Microbacterium sp.]HWI31733.1 DUF3488 and transglutaminase-like domain-containing protein [Microbacterium sp.]